MESLDLIDAPVSTTTRKSAAIDLAPLREKLHQLLLAPAGTKAIPVKLTGDRGDGLQTVRKGYTQALASMGVSKTTKGEVAYDPTKVKLTIRNSQPGTKKPTLVYVKWKPLDETAE